MNDHTLLLIVGNQPFHKGNAQQEEENNDDFCIAYRCPIDLGKGFDIIHIDKQHCRQAYPEYHFIALFEPLLVQEFLLLQKISQQDQQNDGHNCVNCKE